MNQLISIVIPTYGRTEKLRKAINSVLSQTYSNLEVIIVDDNKDLLIKENNVHLISEIGDHRVKYIDLNGNVGAAKARNTGIMNASGYFIAFLDDDDVWAKTKLMKQIIVFNEAKVPNIGVVYCEVSLVKKQREFAVIKTYQNDFSIQNQFFTNVCSTSTIMTKRSVLDEIGYFDDVKSGQDFLLNLKILSKGYSYIGVREKLVSQEYEYGDRITFNRSSINGAIDSFNISKKFFKFLSQKEIQKYRGNFYFTLFHKLIYFEDRKNAKKVLGKFSKYFGSRYFLSLFLLIFSKIFGGKKTIVFSKKVNFLLKRLMHK